MLVSLASLSFTVFGLRESILRQVSEATGIREITKWNISWKEREGICPETQQKILLAERYRQDKEPVAVWKT